MRLDRLRGQLDGPGEDQLTSRPLAFVAIAPLIAIALISAAGRAIALATGGEPFAWLYSAFPPGAVEDNRILSQWFADHAALTWVHIACGSVVLALAPFQFVPWWTAFSCRS